MLPISHGDGPSRARPVTRAPQSLSRTKPPRVRRDVELWPDWTDVPIDLLGFYLPGENQRPIVVGGGDR
jgi:hypothetical protein